MMIKVPTSPNHGFYIETNNHGKPQMKRWRKEVYHDEEEGEKEGEEEEEKDQGGGEEGWTVLLETKKYGDNRNETANTEKMGK